MPHPRRGFMRQGGVFAREREPFSFMVPCASGLKAVASGLKSIVRCRARYPTLPPQRTKASAGDPGLRQKRREDGAPDAMPELTG